MLCAEGTLYPNPVKQGESFLVKGSGELSIYTLNGVRVFNKEVSEVERVATERFVPGAYLVSLTSEEGQYQMKLIVE